MKRFAKLIIVFISLILCFSWITQVKYDISILDYIKYSMPLNSVEKAYLKNKGGITYGADKNAAPISFVNKKNGQNQGLVIDYMTSLSIELGTTINYKPLAWKGVIHSLEEGKIDMSDLFPSKIRHKKFDFSQAMYSLRGVLVTRKDNNIFTLEDLKQKTVAVAEGDYSEELLREESKKGLGINLWKVESIQEALNLLARNKVDAIAGDETVIDYYSKDIEEELNILKEPLYEKDVTLAVKKENKVLLNILNKGILKLKQKNILVQTQQKWFGSSAPIITDITSYRWIPTVIIVIFATIILLYIWNDIMQKKIKEKTQEIEIQRSSLQTIIDNIKIYLIVINKENLVLECNEAAIKLCNTEKSSIVGHSISEFTIISELYEKGCNKKLEIYKHGNLYFNIDINEIEGTDGHRLVLIRDVTDTILGERRIRQQNKMIAVGQLSAGLAHEIRNPLGLIKNYKYIMKKYAVDDISNHAIDVIENSVDRINSLIENLLNFSRQGKEVRSYIDIVTLIDSILDLEEKRLEKKKIKVKKKYDCAEKFYTDEEALKIIIFNLLNNAIEAFEGYNNSEENLITINAKLKEQQLWFSITDNGPGINEEKIENIFNPFYTTKLSGTGLGLYLVSSELEKLNGNISVDSDRNKGSKFIVIIPDKGEQNGL